MSLELLYVLIYLPSIESAAVCVDLRQMEESAAITIASFCCLLTLLLHSQYPSLSLNASAFAMKTTLPQLLLLLGAAGSRTSQSFCCYICNYFLLLLCPAATGTKTAGTLLALPFSHLVWGHCLVISSWPASHISQPLTHLRAFLR
jgi:hypothetical protein